MARQHIKRETDLQIMGNWIEEKARVLDIGCGRGVFLDHLVRTRDVYGLGVDINPDKILSCVKRGLNVYQGDATHFLSEFEAKSFDWIVLSRTLEEMDRPASVVLDEALRVGRCVAVGFVNFGYWLNRWSILRTGSRPRNEVFPYAWEHSFPINPASISAFERYCASVSIRIDRAVYLRGDWNRRCRWWAPMRAGYAVYALSRS